MAAQDLAKRLDHPLFGDAYLATIFATGAVFALADWGFLLGLLCGLVVGVPAIFVMAVATTLFAGDDPHSRRVRPLACLALALVVAELARQLVGLPGLAVGLGLFAFTGARAFIRDRHVLKDRPLPPARDRVAAAIAALPANLGVALRARVDAASEDFRQLQEILADPALASEIGVDAPAMLAEAEQVLLTLLAQAPRVARVQALADRRADDPAAREAAAAAFAALGQRSDALHHAASAAIQLAAASAAGDTASLRDHTENLRMLRAAHAELDRP